MRKNASKNWARITWHWPAIIMLIFFGYLFFTLLSSHMLFEKSDGLYSGGGTWGDLALHLSIISSAVERGISALQIHPVYADYKFSYSSAFDILSAVLMHLGLSLRSSLIFPSFAFLMCFTFGMYMLGTRITKSRLGGFLTPFIFFFNGTIDGAEHFYADFTASGMSFTVFLNSMTKEYAHLGDFNIRFSNIITDYVLPQRAFIPGFALGIIVLYFLWRYWEKRNKYVLLIAGIVTSLLPFLHIHSFLALSMAAVFLALGDVIHSIIHPQPALFMVSSDESKSATNSDIISSKKILLRKRLHAMLKTIYVWMYFAIPIIVIAIPQVLWLFPFGNKSFLHLQLGWMKGNDTFWEFWGKNLGLHLPVIILAFVMAEKKVRSFYLAFVGIFIITNIIIFQPHDYDNMKLMIWWYLTSSILISVLCVQLIKRYRWTGSFAVGLLMLLLTVTGILSIYHESYTSWLMFSREDMTLAAFVRTHTPPDARFLTSDKHNHPIPCLAGRQILMGFRGWLWTHGVNYTQREQEVYEMYSGGPRALELLQADRIDYVLVERDKLSDFRMNLKFFTDKFSVVYQSPNYILFHI